jgi:hypothetical protein
MIRIQDASLGSGLKTAITVVDRTGSTAREAIKTASVMAHGKPTTRARPAIGSKSTVKSKGKSTVKSKGKSTVKTKGIRI